MHGNSQAIHWIYLFQYFGHKHVLGSLKNWFDGLEFEISSLAFQPYIDCLHTIFLRPVHAWHSVKDGIFGPVSTYFCGFRIGFQPKIDFLGPKNKILTQICIILHEDHEYHGFKLPNLFKNVKKGRFFANKSCKKKLQKNHPILPG